MIEEPEASRACVNITHHGTGLHFTPPQSSSVCNVRYYVYVVLHSVVSLTRHTHTYCVYVW